MSCPCYLSETFEQETEQSISRILGRLRPLDSCHLRLIQESISPYARGIYNKFNFFVRVGFK